MRSDPTEPKSLRRAMLAIALAFVASCLVSTSTRADDSDWQSDAAVDQDLGAFDDPLLLRVLTELPDQNLELYSGQPLKQQPLFAQDDFFPQAPSQSNPNPRVPVP